MKKNIKCGHDFMRIACEWFVTHKKTSLFLQSIVIFAIFVRVGFAVPNSGAPGGTRNLGEVMFNLVNDVKYYILTISTVAVSVGVGSGVLMKKFSLGKQDKMELGNKIIKDSIIGWFVLNGVPMIINFLGAYTQ